jgi:hypothetical protein
MKAKVQWMLFFSLFIIPLLCSSQTRKLSGTVISFKKYPVKGITIKAKKAKTEAKTNESGEFEIEVKNKDVIKINESVFLDYTQKITDDIESLTINLIFNNNGRNIEVATEAGYISREDLEYGIEHLYQANNIYANFVDVFDAIKYALPETTIIVENGNRAIQIRGAKSVYGSNAALMVVDGVIVEDVSFISPQQIVSISKLPNSQASLYGARAGNGVILIETW